MHDREVARIGKALDHLPLWDYPSLQLIPVLEVCPTAGELHYRQQYICRNTLIYTPGSELF